MDIDIKPSIYLASQSPRRAELLDQIGVRFEVLSVETDESAQPGESIEEHVRRLALKKARAGWAISRQKSGLPVLGADTIVVRDGRFLGKPLDRDQAIQMLQLLSAGWHQVMSAVALVNGDAEEVSLSTSRVQFATLDGAWCASYWATGEPADKAGAYAIQGIAASKIRSLDGSYSGVMGLPLYETSLLLRQFGVAILGASL